MVTFRTKVYRKEIMHKIEKGIEERLDSVGQLVMQEAKENCPVKSGKLQKSIEKDTDKEVARIGTDVEYGKFVELGTRKIQPGRFFLTKAFRQNIRKIMNILEKDIRWI